MFWIFKLNCFFFNKSKLIIYLNEDKIGTSSSTSTTSSSTTNSNSNSTLDQEAQSKSDVLDHYKFLLLIRNQFLQTNPFKNDDDSLKNKHFKTIFDNLKHHYTELMSTLDSLSNEAKAITDIYKENVWAKDS